MALSEWNLHHYSIVCFLDNDMLVPPNFIQQHYNLHKLNSHQVVMGARRFLTEFKLKEFGEETLIKNFELLEKLSWYSDERITDNIDIQPWRFVFSHTLSIEKNDFLEAGQFNIEFGNHWGFEDIELGVRLQKIKCKFYLIKDNFTYHQPHFQQSNIEQHEKSYNERLFMKFHNGFESELYKCFYNNFYEYYSCLLEQYNNFNCPTKSQIREFDKIFGCLISLDGERKISSKVQLGIYSIDDDLSKKRLLILNAFFNYPEMIKISILFEAYRVASQIYFEDLTEEQEFEIIHLSLKSGIVANQRKENNYTIFVKEWDQDSKLFLFLLPDVYQPEKRYVYLWLANELLKKGNFVKIRDMKNTRHLGYEDLYFDKEIQNELENNIDRYFGKNRVQFIGSAAVLMSDMEIDFPLSKTAYIFSDDDYQIAYNSIKQRHIGQCTCYDESTYSILSLLSVYDSVILERKINVSPEKNSYICFMENGFREDGIDITLQCFSQIVSTTSKAKLIIKIPDYENINKETYPLHNKSSIYAKIFASTQKFNSDYQMLTNMIENLGIKDNVFIVRKNCSIKEICHLENQVEATMFFSRGICASPQFYISILLRKKTIISEHIKFINELKSYCTVLNSSAVDFSRELNLPISCLNSNYLAYKTDTNYFLDKLQILHECLSDSIEEKIIENAKKCIINLF